MISIIIPTLNEEKNLSYVLKDVKKWFLRNKMEHEILVVDGYSSDTTVQIAKRNGARVLYDSIGKGSALRVGMKKARGDIIIMMDADYSHRAVEFGLLIEGIRAGYDVCMGSRFIQGGGSDDITFLRRIGNKFFVNLVNIIWGTKYSDLCYGYRSFNKKAIHKLKLTSNGFGIETEISIKSAKLKLRVLEIPSYEK